MTTTLPPIDGAVLAEILDTLPPRLRKRLDATAQKAADWPLTHVPAGPDSAEDLITAQVDDETTVTVRIKAGAVRSAEDVHCTCLLAPACLHRAALAGLAPPLEAGATTSDDASTSADALATPPLTADPTTAQHSTPETPRSLDAPPTTPPQRPARATLTDPERQAAHALWDTGSALLNGGMIGASLFNEAQVRRAAHQARALGLFRAAALGNRVAAGLRGARERRDDYSLPQLVADLRDLLLLARALLRITDPAELADLRGEGRRGYDHQGGLRLYGLFTEPIIADSGHAGVVTYLVDDTGTLWTTANVMPGGVERVRPSYNTAAGLGGTVVSHRELTRGGLIVSGASASADGRLSTGGPARAVKAAGARWHEPPIDALFHVPLEQQVERAFRAVGQGPDDGARAGADLVFAHLRVLGPTEFGFAAVAESGETVQCVSALAGHGLPYRRNLEILARQDLQIRVVARLDPHRPATLRVLAASPSADQPSTAEDVALQPEWAGRINLGLDSLTTASVIRSAQGAQETQEPDPPQTAHGSGSPLHLLRHRVEQAVAGGRIITATAVADRDAARLRRASLHTAGDLLTELVTTAAPRRDAFGRPLPDDRYLEAWLAAAHYEAVASQRFLLRRWLRS